MKNKVISFLYHEVIDDPTESGFQRIGALPYKHKVKHFLNDIKLIKEIYDKSEYVYELNEENTENKLILTFDDGGVSALTIADILNKEGLIGHFFVTTSMIGNNLFLSEENVQKIRDMGHLIGAHSHTHPSPFREISYDQKVEEWSRSKRILQDILTEDIICASVPGGDMDNDTIKSAGEVGIRFLFTSEPSYRPYSRYGVKVFGRVCPKVKTKSKQITQWASGRGFWKNTIIRKAKSFVKIRFKFIYNIYNKRNMKDL